MLEGHGWRRAPMEPESPCEIPIFALTNKRGSDFAARGADTAKLPHVRQFPQDCTARLDDKLALLRLLTDASAAALPSTQSFLPETCGAEDDVAVERLVCSPGGAGGFFVKHRWGAKGQSVRFCADARAVRAILGKWSHHARRDAIVQRAVAPPLLVDGRKFVVRTHVALIASRCAAPPCGRRKQTTCGHTNGYAVVALMHTDHIVVAHARGYEGVHDNAKAAHVSQAGKACQRPSALTLSEVFGTAGERPDACAGSNMYNSAERCVRTQIRRAAAETVRLGLQNGLLPAQAQARDASLPASCGCACGESRHPVMLQLFGFDFAIDALERVFLLEVNSHPAIASGSMAHVQTERFTALIRDLLSAVVLPVLDEGHALTGRSAVAAVRRAVNRGAGGQFEVLLGAA